MAFKSGSLLVGESLDHSTRDLVVEAMERTVGVDRLINLQAIHMDEDARAALPWYEWEIYVEPDIWRVPRSK